MLLSIIILTFVMGNICFCITICDDLNDEVIYNNKLYKRLNSNDSDDSDEESIYLNKYEIVSTSSSDDDL